MEVSNISHYFPLIFKIPYFTKIKPNFRTFIRVESSSSVGFNLQIFISILNAVNLYWVRTKRGEKE